MQYRSVGSTLYWFLPFLSSSAQMNARTHAHDSQILLFAAQQYLSMLPMLNRSKNGVFPSIFFRVLRAHENIIIIEIDVNALGLQS